MLLAASRRAAAAASTPVRGAPARAAAAALSAKVRHYQGGLADKDRIFTNLYNDQSPYLEAAKKRVRGRAGCARGAAAVSAVRPEPSAPRLRSRRATGTEQRTSCCSAPSRSSPT